jgi:hypothetical protein
MITAVWEAGTMHRIVAFAGIVGLSLGWAVMPAGAGNSSPFVSTPSSGPPGTVIHTSDTNFNCDSPGAAVHIELIDPQQHSAAAADTTVANDSTWRADVTVPNDATPGDYFVAASCTDGELRVVYTANPFTVTAAVATSTTTSTTVPATTTTTTVAPQSVPTTVPAAAVPTAAAATPVVVAPALTG